jgi:hypothetical protein
MATKETKSGIVIEDFRKDYLFGLPSRLRKPEEWSDDFLFNKIRAAENELERTLDCYYTPKRIVCEPGANLVQGQDYDIAEAAYNYSSDFYQGENWGQIRLRRYPVHRSPLPTVVFAYPNVDNRIFTVPPAWVRLNEDYGVIRLVPNSSSIAATFSAFILTIFSGGRGVPQSIFVNYTAGFSGVTEKGDLADNFQDLVELTKHLAILNIVDEAFLPSSVSNSTDGISQSFSYQLKDYRENYEKKFGRFRDMVKGIRMGVL